VLPVEFGVLFKPRYSSSFLCLLFYLTICYHIGLVIYDFYYLHYNLATVSVPSYFGITSAESSCKTVEAIRNGQGILRKGSVLAKRVCRRSLPEGLRLLTCEFHHTVGELIRGLTPPPAPPLSRRGESSSPFPNREGGWGVRFSEFGNSFIPFARA